MANYPNKRSKTGAGGMSKSDEEDTEEEETDSQELDEVQNLMRDLSMGIPDEIWNHSIEYLDFNQQLTGAPDRRWRSNRAFQVIVLAKPFDGVLPQNMYNTFWDAMLVYYEFRERWPYRLFTIRLQMAYGPKTDRNRASSLDYAKTFRTAVAILSMASTRGDNLTFLRFLTSKVEIIFENRNMSVIYAPRVTKIVESQFRLVKNLTSVNVPDTLETIELRAFEGCSSLSSFIFPSALTGIKNYGFQASGLVSVDLSTTRLTVIEEYVFCSCTNLTSVIFPDSLQTIKKEAFNKCSSLASVSWTHESSASSAAGGEASLGTFGSAATFPPALQTIGDHAFASCLSLTSLYLPISLRAIGYGAFSDSGIVSVILSTRTLLQNQALPNSAVVTFYGDYEVGDATGGAGRNDSSGGGGAGGAASQFCELRF